jgi:NOL1/NOP2/fmu family ribosome biogenesis protein
MPRPFQFPINIGTDICSVQRIYNILTVNNGTRAEAFLRRIFTEKEREQFHGTNYSNTLLLWERSQRKKLELDKRSADHLIRGVNNVEIGRQQKAEMNNIELGVESVARFLAGRQVKPPHLYQLS